MKVFIGYDERQPLAYNVLQHSIFKHASAPVAITALHLPQLQITRRGLTAFTFSRFLVPFLCDYKGVALFLDADMVVSADIKELFDAFDHSSDVQVNKNQKPFEWPSAMLFNCAACRILTPEYVDDKSNVMFDFKWAKEVGEFPKEWNACVGYEEVWGAKLYHYTKGIPCWKETRGNPEDKHWHEAYKSMLHTVSHEELMGQSVHVRAAC